MLAGIQGGGGMPALPALPASPAAAPVPVGAPLPEPAAGPSEPAGPGRPYTEAARMVAPVMQAGDPVAGLITPGSAAPVPITVAEVHAAASEHGLAREVAERLSRQTGRTHAVVAHMQLIPGTDRPDIDTISFHVVSLDPSIGTGDAQQLRQVAPREVQLMDIVGPDATELVMRPSWLDAEPIPEELRALDDTIPEGLLEFFPEGSTVHPWHTFAPGDATMPAEIHSLAYGEVNDPTDMQVDTLLHHYEFRDELLAQQRIT